MTLFLLSQILIAIAFLFDMISFQFRRREAILFCFLVAGSLNVTHFFLLNNFSAGGLALVTLGRYGAAYFSKSRIWLWLFIPLSLVVLNMTYASPISLLPCFASIFGAIITFQPKDKTLRSGTMLCTFAWMIHNALAKDPAAFALEVFFLTSNLIGYWRFYGRKNPDQSATPLAMPEV